MRFEEECEGWNKGRLTQAKATQILGMRERSFRRYLARYEAEGLEGLIDRMTIDDFDTVSEVLEDFGHYPAAELPSVSRTSLISSGTLTGLVT